MIKYNHSLYRLVPFGDIAFKSIEGIQEKFKDYIPVKPDSAQHNLPG